MSRKSDSPVQTQMAVALFRSPLGREYIEKKSMGGRQSSGRRRVFVQTETGCVLGMELDRSDNAHTVKRRLQIALNVPTEESSLTFGDVVLNNDLSSVRNDTALLLTRNLMHRSSSTPCLSPTGRDMQQKDKSGPIEIVGQSSSLDIMKHMVKDIVKAMQMGIDPIPVNSGLGGAYYFLNKRGESVAIVKPTDEEPFAPNNPKGFVGKALGQPGLKRSVRVGETGFREVAAYLLDYGHFAKVPPTALVKITHSIFNVNDGVNGKNIQSKKVVSKIASLQQFIPHDFDASDYGTSGFPVTAVHRIGILDIRILNTDRHGGNLLVRKVGAFGEVDLIPIDHGLCLPEALEDPYFEWIHWPQASIPFSEDELSYIENLDPAQDCEMLRKELPMIREACLRVLVLCTIFLKEAAAYGLCLAEIGEMMTREFRSGEEEPSELEVVCLEARNMLAEREELSPQTDLRDDEFLFDIDCDVAGSDLTLKMTMDDPLTRSVSLPGLGNGNGRNPFSKLYESIEDDRKEKLEVVEGDGKEELEVVEVDNKEGFKYFTRRKFKSKKRTRRVEATKGDQRLEENQFPGRLDESKSQEVELVVVLDTGEESASVPETELAHENLIDSRDENAATGNEEKIETDNLQAEECSGDVELSPMEHVESLDEQGDKIESEKEGIYASNVDEIAGVSTKQADNEGAVDKEVGIDENVSKDENIGKRDELKQASNDKSGYRCIKEGRRCGLCGRGSDGKPPKRLVQDNGESENEAYSGSSASEEPTYETWDGFDDEPGWLGRLLGPINDRYGIAGIWVHQNCAVWSPEVYFAGLGCLKNVRAALCRGRALKCTRCGRRGATIGCRVDRCPKTYHLACARANGCIFDHRKFLIACTDHRHLFQPCGDKYLARLKKLRARKMMWETKKRSNDASRKDIDAEEKWLENCGEDEEFLKRENKRLHRDILRIAPVYIGGSDSSASENSFQGWESVAGLNDVIRCMKEVVIIPLLYPNFFDNLGLTPPRGVLLHGYPGTGKTLVVRSLIGACARGDRRIAYFARKGADCLGKYVGDAERQLRLLFQVAEKCQPSIIFFDEIDGLAPSRTRQQDQTHSSVVSTLLALMDGLKSRGSVVVIGATNRPDAVDPALRRPGRFDREIYFPLPSTEDRASILSLHTQKWPKPISGSLLGWIAKKTSGFAGADLQALCTQAAMNALKRNFPLQEVLSVAEKRHSSDCKNIPLPSFTVEERDWVDAFLSSPSPCSQREAGNAANDVSCSPLPVQLAPCLLRPLCTILVSLYLDERLWLPLPISRAVTLIKNVMVSALGKKKMPIDHWWLHLDDFLIETNIAYEVSKCLSGSGILSADHGFSGFCDIVDHADENSSIKNHGSLFNGRLPDTSFGMTNKSGFRILIYGNPRSGQRHLASCLLYCFIGNIEVQKIDMATISQEGHGDVMQGITQILMKCASMKSCVIFMPRIDLWAVEEDLKIAEKTDSCSINHLSSETDKSSFTPSQIIEKENGINTGKNSTEITKCQANKKASYAWMSFIEQVETIGLSTSLMILATAEVPYTELPQKITGFFKSYQTKDTQSTPLVQTVPQFSLQIDGNFDHDLAINLSSIELLRTVVEQRVQLIHQRSHAHMGAQKRDKAYESIEVCKDKVTARKENEPANEKGEVQFPESLTKVPQPNSRSVKGKSNLLMAISTFGYQILLYPHFAELCWVTSKLKEGPCADVSGPWRGWPFNSCIIRPNNSQDKVVIAGSSGGTKSTGSSGGTKSKESAGLVRGLVAVGLSAYKGVYKSVREVSFEVRKVLEILTEMINMKIQAGRNRYQYLRILSQVAYLEDMVNNWAYALLSLDQDSPELAAKVIPTAGGSLNSHLPCEDRHQTEGEDCPLIVPADGNDLETLERSPKGVPTATTECLSLNDINDNLGNTDRDGQKECSEGSQPNHPCPDTHINDSCLANQPPHPSLNQENGVLSESVTAENYEAADGELGMSKDLNKSTCTRPAIVSENGFHTTCEQESVEIGGNSKSSDVESDKHENAEDINASSSKDMGPAESEFVCLYQCCPQCLHSLYNLTHKILVREWGSNRSHRTIEDVHDAVSLLSVDLISAVRKCYMAEDFTDLSSNKTSVKCFNSITCNTENGGKDVVSAECISHSGSQDTSVIKHAAVNEAVKLDLKFVFRDGVLVPMDPAKDAPLHCKFEKLCLCSLIELIVKTKGSLD